MMWLRTAFVSGLLACSLPLFAQQKSLYSQTPEQIYQQALDSVYSYFGTGLDLMKADSLLNVAERRRLPDSRLMLARAEAKFRNWRFHDNQPQLRSDARSLLQKVLETGDNLPRAYALLGQIEWSEGCTLCAKLRAEQTLRRDPGNSDGLFLNAIEIGRAHV